MNKSKSEFAVESKNGIVQRIGKSVVNQPITNHSDKGIQWFDDNQLIKANKQ